MSEILLTATKVAERIGVSRPTLYTWQRNGRFTVQPIDDRKPPRWRCEDIDAWLHPSTASETVGG